MRILGSKIDAAMEIYRDFLLPLYQRFLAWIFRDPATEPDAWRRRGMLAARLAYVLIRGLSGKRLQVYASSLTYITMLSLLPLVAVLLAAAKQWSPYDIPELKAMLIQRLPELETILTQVMDYVAQTNFGSLGLAGTVFLLGAIFKMMGKIEDALNDTWGVRKARPLWRKAFDYSGVLIASSLLLVGAWTAQIVSTDLVSRYMPYGLKLLNNSFSTRIFTLMVLGLGFTVLLKYLPNARTPWWSTLIGGMTCGLLYTLLSAGYFGLQVGMANYNLVYSSLAALPITIIWIDISWVIVLISAELAYALSNLHTFRYEVMDEIVSSEFLEASALRVSLHLAQYGEVGEEKAPSLGALSRKLRLPGRFLAQLLTMLQHAGIVQEVSKQHYLIAENQLASVHLHDVVLAVRQRGLPSERNDGGNQDVVESYLKQTEHSLRDGQSNLTLKQALALSSDAGETDAPSSTTESEIQSL